MSRSPDDLLEDLERLTNKQMPRGSDEVLTASEAQEQVSYILKEIPLNSIGKDAALLVQEAREQLAKKESASKLAEFFSALGEKIDNMVNKSPVLQALGEFFKNAGEMFVAVVSSDKDDRSIALYEFKQSATELKTAIKNAILGPNKNANSREGYSR